MEIKAQWLSKREFNLTNPDYVPDFHKRKRQKDNSNDPITEPQIQFIYSLLARTNTRITEIEKLFAKKINEFRKIDAKKCIDILKIKL